MAFASIRIEHMRIHKMALNIDTMKMIELWLLKAWRGGSQMAS